VEGEIYPFCVEELFAVLSKNVNTMDINLVRKGFDEQVKKKYDEFVCMISVFEPSWFFYGNGIEMMSGVINRRSEVA
jgi:hypothetical protein